MSTQDNRLIPVSLDRGLDRPLSDLMASKPYGVTPDPGSLKDYLFVILKRKWLILSLVLVITSLVAIQSFRAPSIYEGETTIRIQEKKAEHPPDRQDNYQRTERPKLLGHAAQVVAKPGAGTPGCSDPRLTS